MNPDDEDFCLPGDAETQDLFLGEKATENSDSNRQKNEKTDLNWIQEIYDLLRLDEKISSQKWEDFFSSNPEIFKVAGLPYFQTMPENEFKEFEKKCDQWIGVAHKNWIDIENQSRLNVFNDALDELKRVFNQPVKTRQIIKILKNKLEDNLNTVLQQKIKDGILDVSEISEMQEIAFDLHLIDDSEEGKKWFADWINKKKKNSDFDIESFEETFIRYAKEKAPIERLDTERCKKNLFGKYKSLCELNCRINKSTESPDDETVLSSMDDLLKKNGLLINNADYFLSNFLNPEIEKASYNFSALPESYYYFLKGTGTYVYQLTEEQWYMLSTLFNIHPESWTSNAFILGKKKSSTIEGIRTLIKENPEMSLGRILAGDLETYFEHIGYKDVVKKIKESKGKFSENQNNLVENVVEILEEYCSDGEKNKKTKDAEQKNISTLIDEKKSFLDFVRFIVENKNDEILYTSLCSETEIKKSVLTFFYESRPGNSYLALLLCVMKDLLQEIDIREYGFAFEKIARGALDIIKRHSDFMTFLYGYSCLIKKAMQMEMLSGEFINTFNEYESLSFDMEKQDKEMFEAKNTGPRRKSFFAAFRK